MAEVKEQTNGSGDAANQTKEQVLHFWQIRLLLDFASRFTVQKI